MGWLWSSSALPAETSKSQETNTVPSLPEPGLNSSTSIRSESPPVAPKRQPTRDEIAESELRSLLEEFEADMRPSSTKYDRVPKTLPKNNSVLKPSNLTLEEELLPTEMSCRQVFDAAFYCQSLGGQFNNLYRYGGIRNCSENWNDFWFCMRTKSYMSEQKEGMIRDHYKRKTLKYKVGPSSEDVWESRDERLEWGEAFGEPIGLPVGSDEDWNRGERMRRELKVQGTM